MRKVKRLGEEESTGFNQLGTPDPQLPKKDSSRVHLGFLDGLRGLSAVWVLFYHTFTFVAHGRGSIKAHGIGIHGLFFAGWMGYGDLGVRIFLVLSGFLLMQPLAVKGHSAIPDLKRFFQRRCLRIMPGYYAVLIASSLMLFIFLKLAARSATFSHLPIPPITIQQIVIHLFMVQNFSRSLQNTINGPLWTVGTEFQIYILFPLLFLPILKRVGPWLFVLAVIVFSSQIHWIELLGPDWIWNGPPFPVCFAVGMVAALVVFSPHPSYQGLRKIRWTVYGFILVVIGLAGLVAFRTNPTSVPVARYYLELPLILGIGCLVTAGALIESGKAAGSQLGGKLVKGLGSPAMVGLAGFSYSLYLTHHPVVVLLSAFASKAHLPALLSVYLVSIIALMICLPLAYGVSLIVEKPFLAKRQASR